MGMAERSRSIDAIFLIMESTFGCICSPAIVWVLWPPGHSNPPWPSCWAKPEDENRITKENATSEATNRWQPDVRIAGAAGAAVSLGVQQDDASIGSMTSLQQFIVFIDVMEP